jgi:hypothetical protein
MSTLTRNGTLAAPKRRGRPRSSSSANARAQDRRDAAQEEATPTNPVTAAPTQRGAREEAWHLSAI